MQEQNINEYYKTIFTLKTGKQIEILTQVPYEEVLKFDETETHMMISLDDGFIATPLLIPKSIAIVKREIAAIESTLEPHITRRNTEPDIRTVNCNHPPDATCPECQPKEPGTPDLSETVKPLVEHKKGCASFNNPPAGFASSVSDCDCGCGAIVKTQTKKIDHAGKRGGMSELAK